MDAATGVVGAIGVVDAVGAVEAGKAAVAVLLLTALQRHMAEWLAAVRLVVDSMVAAAFMATRVGSTAVVVFMAEAATVEAGTANRSKTN